MSDASTAKTADPPSLHEIVTDAVKFWELGRLVYNAVLTGVVLAILGTGVFDQILNNGLGLLALAVFANVLYTSAYIPDLLAQHTPWREVWRQFRFILWLFGMGFASVFAALMVYAFDQAQF